MAKVTATINTQKASTTVAATAPGFAGLVLALIASSGATFATQTATPGNYSVDFDNVPSDTYTVTAQAVDASNAPLGTLYTSTPFSITDDPAPAPAPTPTPIPAPQTVTLVYDQPISISVTQS